MSSSGDIDAAESSLQLDREHKGSLYARSGLDDYWIVNLVDRLLELSRQPVQHGRALFGWRYASRQMVQREACVAPLAAPAALVRVADLLP